jgi:hypothetical protein
MNFKQFLEMSNQKIFGWMSPRGNFYPSEVYEHLESIGKIPELKALVPNYDQEMEAIEHLARWSRTQMDLGEHPEWHSYEMAKDEFAPKAIEALYAAGCLRVGSVQNVIHFEGKPAGIQNLHQKAKDFAEEHGMIAKFDPQKPQRNYWDG